MLAAEFDDVDHGTRSVLPSVSGIEVAPELIMHFLPSTLLTPLHQCRRSGQGAWFAAECIQVMLEIEDLLASAKTTLVPADTPAFVPDLDICGIYLYLDLHARPDRCRI